jgi:hypothetical protein
LFVAVGLSVATLGYCALMVRSVVIDSGVTVEAATAALHDNDVRTMLAERTTDAISSQLIGDTVAEDLAAFGVDVREDLTPVARDLLVTPEFEHAYATAVQQVHDHVFVDPKINPTIDVSALVARARAAAIAVNPAYQQLIPPQATLVVEIPMSSVPDLTVVDRQLAVVRALVALLVGALIVLLAVAVAPADGLRRSGRWLLALGGIQLTLCVGAQLLLRRVSGDAGPIARAAGGAVLPRIAQPALLPLALGVVALAGAARLDHVAGRRLVKDGRDAFLTDEDGTPSEWRFDEVFEPQTLRTAPSTVTYQR